MTSTWEEFYAKTPKPSNLGENEDIVKKFVEQHVKENNKIVLVTSGGTTVPLEHNTVRFVDNFSAGTRGSISAEYFLEHGYAVIFMYRIKSLEPFNRHFSGHKLLDMMETTTINGEPSVSVAPQYVNEISVILKKYKDSVKHNRLVQVGFTTLAEYLWLLQSICQILAPLESQVMLYLAAAVSDFYIPSNKMAVHKMPSNETPSIHLQLVPKILGPLVKFWVNKAFVISFKLETNEDILISKAREALRRYNHALVIANILQTRKQKVVIVRREDNYTVSLTDEQMKNGEEIEKFIVADLVKKHESWMSSHKRRERIYCLVKQSVRESEIA